MNNKMINFEMACSHGNYDMRIPFEASTIKEAVAKFNNWKLCNKFLTNKFLSLMDYNMKPKFIKIIAY